MTLEATEFIRRFLMHVLPSGFMRIRHFGFLANRVREEKLGRVRTLLEPPAMPAAIAAMIGRDGGDRVSIEFDNPEDSAAPLCPHCKNGRLRLIEVSLPGQRTVALCPG